MRGSKEKTKRRGNLTVARTEVGRDRQNRINSKKGVLRSLSKVLIRQKKGGGTKASLGFGSVNWLRGGHARRPLRRNFGKGARVTYNEKGGRKGGK